MSRVLVEIGGDGVLPFALIAAKLWWNFGLGAGIVTISGGSFGGHVPNFRLRSTTLATLV
jgi:hypothetical protein